MFFTNGRDVHGNNKVIHPKTAKPETAMPL
jgi:hypothetical protein